MEMQRRFTGRIRLVATHTSSEATAGPAARSYHRTRINLSPQPNEQGRPNLLNLTDKPRHRFTDSKPRNSRQLLAAVPWPMTAVSDTSRAQWSVAAADRRLLQRIESHP